MARSLACAVESFPLSAPFTISRGAKTEAVVVHVTIADDNLRGQGECVPYTRYGETPASVMAQIESVRARIEAGVGREELQELLPAGAARNALDCALWDFDAKRLGVRAFELAGLHRIAPATTAYTISVGTPDAMAQAARAAARYPILKIKLAGEGDPERIRAVREAAPDSELIVDANEACSDEQLQLLFDVCAQAGVGLIEQPLPAGRDDALAQIRHSVPVCADESIHDRRGLAQLRSRYDVVNIKLDKAGGLTEALALARQAQELGFLIMIGSMVGTSLATAPAILLTPFARWIDLDGPLLLARDRFPQLRFDNAIVSPPDAALWG